jgi:hypothetical protein
MIILEKKLKLLFFATVLFLIIFVNTVNAEQCVKFTPTAESRLLTERFPECDLPIITPYPKSHVVPVNSMDDVSQMLSRYTLGFSHFSREVHLSSLSLTGNVINMQQLPYFEKHCYSIELVDCSEDAEPISKINELMFGDFPPNNCWIITDPDSPDHIERALGIMKSDIILKANQEAKVVLYEDPNCTNLSVLPPQGDCEPGEFIRRRWELVDKILAFNCEQQVTGERYECVECVTDNDCTEGEGSQTQTGICCGGSCMNDSVNNVCCTSSDDPDLNCGEIFNRNNGQPDAIIEQNGECNTAGPSTLPDIADIKAISANAPLPEGWLEVESEDIVTSDSLNRLIEQRSSYVRRGFAQQVTDNDASIFNVKIKGVATTSAEEAPLTQEWSYGIPLTLTSSTEDSRHQWFKADYDLDGEEGGWTVNGGARIDTFTVVKSSTQIAGYNTIITRVNTGSRASGRSRGGGRAGGERVTTQVPYYGTTFSEHDENVASGTLGFAWEGKGLLDDPLRVSAGMIINPYGVGGEGGVEGNWVNLFTGEVYDATWGINARYIAPPDGADPDWSVTIVLFSVSF